MDSLLLWVGRISALAGVFICALAILGRLTGTFFFGGFQIGTLLQAGIVAMLVACVCFLMILTSRTRR